MATFNGTPNNDTLQGTIARDTITAFDGNDRISGEGENDLIDAGSGNDIVFGDAGEGTAVGRDATALKLDITNVRPRSAGETAANADQPGDSVIYDRVATLEDGTQVSARLTLLSVSNSGLRVDLTGGSGSEILLNGVNNSGERGSESANISYTEIEQVIICFTPGTAIVTPRGEVPIEKLREGDRVFTRDNGLHEIRWIGRTKLGARQIARMPEVAPIVIRKGALGSGMPERDLVVSPNHRVLITSDLAELMFDEREVLIAVKHLVGLTGVEQAEPGSTSYIHMLFDHHEVILSNGAWTESFQPGDYSLRGIGDGQRAEILDLFPELSQKAGLDGFRAARRALKGHEARLIMREKSR